MKVKISKKCFLLKFHICDVRYIKEICYGRCCNQKVSRITILEEEVERISRSGGAVMNGILQLVNGKCPFKYQGLCGLHESGMKPFGCIMSPFNLNKNNTLIIRHRYISMCCYGTKKSSPAYKVHRKSLELIFMDKTDEVIKQVLKSKTNIYVDLDDKIYNKIKEKEENIYRTKENNNAKNS